MLLLTIFLLFLFGDSCLRLNNPRKGCPVDGIGVGPKSRVLKGSELHKAFLEEQYCLLIN